MYYHKDIIIYFYCKFFFKIIYGYPLTNLLYWQESVYGISVRQSIYFHSEKKHHCNFLTSMFFKILFEGSFKSASASYSSMKERNEIGMSNFLNFRTLSWKKSCLQSI